MDHDSIRRNLEAYHDGELSAGERAPLDAHLADCRACREELASLGTLGRALGALRESAPSDAFVSRVMAALPREEDPAPAASASWLWPAFAFAAAGLWLSVAWPAREPAPGAETLLLAGLPEDSTARRALDGREAGLDEVLGLVLEAP